MIFPPPGHPSSVGLLETYVKLIKKGLQAAIQHDPSRIFQWDELLPDLVHALNTQVIQVMGFTPAELLFGYNPRRKEALESICSILWASAANFLKGADQGAGASIQKVEHDVQLAKLDEWRTLAAQRQLEQHQRDITRSKSTRWSRPEAGDLVLLRQYALDTQKGRKLEPRWQGPYKVQSQTRNGQSLNLTDLQSDQSIGRHHVDNCKVYWLRKKEDSLQRTVQLNHKLDDTWA